MRVIIWEQTIHKIAGTGPQVKLLSYDCTATEFYGLFFSW